MRHVLTPEERRRAGHATQSKLTPEQRVDKATRASAAASNEPCPHGCSCARHNGLRARQLREANHMKEEGQREAARKRAEARLATDEENYRSRLGVEATREGVKPPSASTLRRYAITAEEWMAILEAQGWRCPICLKPARSVRLNTDHDHVPMWDHLAPEERRRYVRGILCAFCNFRRVNSRMPAAEARRIADYLERYEERRGA